MESDITYKLPAEVTDEPDLVEDPALAPNENHQEVINDSEDVASAVSSKLSITDSKDASSLEDLRRVFSALHEDFSPESRDRYIAFQMELLDQYRPGATSRSQSVDSDREIERSAVIGLHAAFRTEAIRQRNALPLTQFEGIIWDDDDDDDEDFDFRGDLYARMRLEVLRRLGFFDEDQRLMHECQVCFDSVRLTVRPCCQKAVCDSCLQQYVETQISENGNIRIECPNPDCKSQMFSDEIRSILRTKPELRDRYDRWIVDLNGDPNRKTCPRCCHITELDPAALSDRKVYKYGLKKECTECHLEWCFPCHSPWHEGMSCKKYRTGDILLRNWAREHIRFGECNAQQCPKCKVSCDEIILFFLKLIIYCLPSSDYCSEVYCLFPCMFFYIQPFDASQPALNSFC